MEKYLVTLAERIYRSGVRYSSPASRVGRLDNRAQRRAKRHFLHADVKWLPSVCTKANANSLRNRLHTACLRSNVKADARHNSIRTPVARLLAAGQSYGLSCVVPFNCRENSSACTVSRLLRGDGFCSNSSRKFACAVTTSAAAGKCWCQRDDLHRANVLADRFGRLLSAHA